MKKLDVASVLSALVCLVPACGPGDGFDEDDLGQGADAALAPNALVPNALSPDGLSPNALSPNALSPNALSPDALSPDALAAIQAPGSTGARSRQLLRYVVSCAFHSSQSFTFTWKGPADDAGWIGGSWPGGEWSAEGEEHREVYEGLIGLAPDWADQPLTDEMQQRLVSACLAARVNWYGDAVWVSLRSGLPPLSEAKPDNVINVYPHVEGAFWGNVFTASPYLNACFNPEGFDAARDAGRDCAIGHAQGKHRVSCGVIALNGPCATWCEALDPVGKFYPSCTDRPGDAGSGATFAVITTALR